MSYARFLPLLLPILYTGCGFGSEDAADGSAPAIQITQPSTATVQGVVDFSALVVDDVGVAVVEFFADDLQVGTDFTDPYTTRWNTVNSADGIVILKVVARDFSGNQAFTSKNVTVANSPN
jgi:hypothetical protein